MVRNNKRRNKSEIEGGLENIEESLTKTEQFIESNQKKIILVILGVVIIILGIFAFNKFYKGPKEGKALVDMYQAEKYFKLDSFRVALEGIHKVGKQASGFLEIIDKHSSTKAANLATYYAGVCYKNLGEYTKAIKYLNDFTSDDFFLQSVAVAAMGDCQYELKNYMKARDLYLKAAKINPNNFSTPMYLLRAGLSYEKAEKYDKALEIYKKLKNQYPNSNESADALKYIVRVNIKKGS